MKASLHLPASIVSALLIGVMGIVSIRPASAFIHFYQTDEVDTYNVNYNDFTNPTISVAMDSKVKADKVGDTSYENYYEGASPILDQFTADEVNVHGSNFSQTQLDPTDIKYHLDLAALTTNPGDVYFNYHLDSTQFPSNAYTGTYNGFTYFEIYQDASACVDNGGVWNYTATVNGDWSHEGIGTHMHQLLATPSAGWVIDQNFVYDANTDTTTFSMHNSNYQYDPTNGTTDCYVGAVLYEQAVPEPASWVALSLGVGLLLVFKRRA